MPSRTAIAFSEPVGWKLTMSPRTKVSAPRMSVACHETVIIPGADSWAPYSSFATGPPRSVLPGQDGLR